MIKITFFSDTHLGFDLPVRPRLNIRRRGEDFFTNTKQVLDQAIAAGSDLIIHGGDLFFRSKVPQIIIDRVYELLFEYAEAGIPIIIVPGNHERSVLPQSILLNHPNLYVFRRVESFGFFINGERVIISGFPNIRNGVRSQFAAIQKKLYPQNDALNILLMHQSIDGCRVENHVFRGDADTIDISEIDTGYDLILSGHIHRRQILTNVRQPVIYCGSVERTSFQEMNEPKGYYFIRMKKRSNRWHPEIEFKVLNDRPMVDLFLDNIISQDNWQVKLRDAINALDKNSIVRLRLKDHTQIVNFELTADILRQIFPDTMNYSLSKSLF